MRSVSEDMNSEAESVRVCKKIGVSTLKIKVINYIIGAQKKILFIKKFKKESNFCLRYSLLEFYCVMAR